MPAALQTTPTVVQLTLSVYMLMLGLGQLISVRCPTAPGRRCWAARCCIAASLALAAGSGGLFVALWLLQALGASAALVAMFATVRDVYADRPEGATIYGLFSAMLAFVLALPMLGAAIAAGFGWRAIFVALGAAGLLAWLRAMPRWRETRPSAPGGGSGFAPMLGSLRFWIYTLGFSAAMGAFFPFDLAARAHGRGRLPHGLQRGLLDGRAGHDRGHAAGAAPGGALGHRRQLRARAATMLAGAALLAGCAATTAPSFATFVMPMWLVAAGWCWWFRSAPTARCGTTATRRAPRWRCTTPRKALSSPGWARAVHADAGRRQRLAAGRLLRRHAHGLPAGTGPAATQGSRPARLNPPRQRLDQPRRRAIRQQDARPATGALADRHLVRTIGAGAELDGGRACVSRQLWVSSAASMRWISGWRHSDAPTSRTRARRTRRRATASRPAARDSGRRPGASATDRHRPIGPAPDPPPRPARRTSRRSTPRALGRLHLLRAAFPAGNRGLRHAEQLGGMRLLDPVQQTPAPQRGAQSHGFEVENRHGGQGMSCGRICGTALALLHRHAYAQRAIDRADRLPASARLPDGGAGSGRRGSRTAPPVPCSRRPSARTARPAWPTCKATGPFCGRTNCGRKARKNSADLGFSTPARIACRNAVRASDARPAPGRGGRPVRGRRARPGRPDRPRRRT